MESTYIPNGYNHVIPYMIVDNAASFMGFLTTVFDAVDLGRHMRDEHTIMHAEMKIADSVVMLADATETYAATPASLFVYVPDADKTFNLAIASGAVPVEEMSDKPYGRAGGFKDPFGNTWWVTTFRPI